MNPFKSYQQRKAEKAANKAAEKEAFKARKAAEDRDTLQSKTRKPEDVEADCDALAKELGKFHHQKVALDSIMQQETQRFHNLLVELDNSRRVWPPKIEAEPTPAQETITTGSGEVFDVVPQA